jgi:hypothetical protein
MQPLTHSLAHLRVNGDKIIFLSFTNLGHACSRSVFVNILAVMGVYKLLFFFQEHCIETNQAGGITCVKLIFSVAEKPLT